MDRTFLLNRARRYSLQLFNPLGTGGSIYIQNFNDQPTESGESRVIHLTLKYLMKPSELEAAINALPAVEALSYELNSDTIAELTAQYDVYTLAERAQLSSDAVAKLQAASARIEEIDREDQGAVHSLISQVNSYYDKITPDNFGDYYRGR